MLFCQVLLCNFAVVNSKEVESVMRGVQPNQGWKRLLGRTRYLVNMVESLNQVYKSICCSFRFIYFDDKSCFFSFQINLFYYNSILRPRGDLGKEN